MSGVHGLDLSLTATGIATTTGVTTIKSKGAATANLNQRADRLVDLTRRIIGALQYADSGDLVLVEQPAYSKTTGHMHDRSGLWWMVVDRLRFAGFNVAEVPPTVLKRYATGKGNASKDEVLLAVAKRWPEAGVSNNNEADAVVLRAMGLHQMGLPAVDLPARHVEALSAVVWP